MPCYTVGQIPIIGPALALIPGVGNTPISSPMTNAFINGLLAWREYEVYKDHRDKLNALATRNKELARIAKGKNNEVEAKRTLLYDQLNEEPTCEPCCDDVKLTVFSTMAQSFKAYHRQSEQLHYSQCGAKQTLLRATLDDLPRAIANTASAYNQEYKICESTRQDYLRGVTTSAYRGDVPSPAILSELARNAADNLNDSSDLFSQFLSETTRSIGYEIGTRANIRENTSAIGLGNNPFVNGDVFNPSGQQPVLNQPVQPFTVPQPTQLTLGDDR